MGTTSAIDKNCSAKQELSIFMERFRHLAAGADVLAKSELDEYAESLPHWGMSGVQTDFSSREEHINFDQSHCNEISTEHFLRSTQDLQTALSVVDLALEKLQLEKSQVAALESQLEDQQQLHRLQSEKYYSSMSEWIGRYKQIFSENVYLRTRIAIIHERIESI